MEEDGEGNIVDAYFDHCIKEIYRQFITEILVGMSKDGIESFRKLSLDILLELISSKPEMEEVILGILINKLGDSSKKVQTHAQSALCRLVKNQPMMASIIVHETQMLL